jgi:hypothetical protein
MLDRLCRILRGETPAHPIGDDGEALFALAREHRVHLLLAQRLKAHGIVLPEALLAETRLEAVRDVLRTRELTRVVAALDAQGCAPLVFKGAALAYSHYEDSWLRPRLDADVLIDAARHGVAVQAFGGLGYVRPAMTAGRLVMHQEIFMRPERGVGEHVIDLHWHLANPNVVADALPHRELRSRAVGVQTFAGSLTVPSPPDALLIACLHRAAHHDDSEHLLWLYDIHMVAQRLGADEWRCVVEIAARSRIKAIGLRGLELSMNRFETLVPATVLDALRRGDHESAEPSAVFLQKGLRPLGVLGADLRALGPVAGLRLILEHLFPPPSYMREAFGATHGALLPAAYARRIVRGVRKWLRPSAPAAE